MKRIFKYEIPVMAQEVIVPMPVGAVPLSVQTQHGRVCLWAIVDDEAEKEDVTFKILGTGHPAEGLEGHAYVYIGTVQQDEGTFIWHIFRKV